MQAGDRCILVAVVLCAVSWIGFLYDSNISLTSALVWEEWRGGSLGLVMKSIGHFSVHLSLCSNCFSLFAESHPRKNR